MCSGLVKDNDGDENIDFIYECGCSPLDQTTDDDNEIFDIVEKKKLSKYFVQTLGSSQSKKDHLIYLINKYKLNFEKCIF